MDAAEIKRLKLDKFLKKKTGLYTYIKNRDPFFKSIVDEKYPFTKEDMDKLLLQLTYKGTRGFLYYFETWQAFADKVENKDVYNLIFKNFKPSDEQVELICSCFCNIYGMKDYKWVKILLENNYKFTEYQIKILLKTGYDVKKIFAIQKLTESEMNVFIDSCFTSTSAINISMENTFKMLTESFSKLENPSQNSLKYLLQTLQSKSVKFWEKDVVTIFEMFKFDETFFDFIIENKINLLPVCRILMKKIPINIKFLNYCSTIYDLVFEVVQQISSNSIQPDVITLNNFLNLSSMANFDFKENEKKISPEYAKDYYYKIYIYLTQIIEKRVEPNIETLRISCRKGHVNIFNDLTINKKLIPDEDCVHFGNNVMLAKILSYKIVPTSEMFNRLVHRHGHVTHNDFLTTLEILINFGFQIKIDDVGYALKNYHTIDNLERFGLDYDEKLYFLCHIYNFFPIDYVSKFTIPKDIVDFRLFCKSAFAKEVFVNWIKKVGFMDQYCIDNFIMNESISVSFKNELMKKVNYQISPIISLHYLQRKMMFNANLILDNLINKFNIDHTYMEQKFKIENPDSFLAVCYY